jgi:L-ascorbate metabolism protein UlaG (beta-lactamase superfamily)
MATVDVRWLGHSAFHLSGGGADVLIDPFLTHNPKAAVSADEVTADVILLTHGHQDHFGDTVDIAKRTGATVVAITEIADELQSQHGLEDVRDPNLGGTETFDWGWVKLTPAWHTGVTPNGTPHTPAGLLISYGGHVLWDLGDTALFSDLQLYGRRGDRVELAFVPIGGHYTMDRYDAVTAVELISPFQTIPIHYGTFPAVETDAQAFKQDVEQAGFSEVVVLEPGGTHQVR